MSSSPHTDVSVDAAPAHRPSSFSARERWTLVAASSWLVTGLQLDAFAHSTIPDLETFWTPWHAVLYSGIAACGLTLLWLLRPRLPKTLTYRSLLHETPRALRLPLTGMALLLVGGGIDTLWHNLFGIEKGLEIFFSPSHYFIISGMVLVACGPALMLAASSARRLPGSDAVMVLVSALLASLPLHIFSEHASALEDPLLGTGADPMDTYSLDAQMFHGYVGSTFLLLIPVLVLGRRWSLPVGVPTVLVTFPALAIMLILGDAANVWLPLTIAIATAVVEVAARTSAPLWRRLAPDARWLVLGLLAPIAVWGSVLGVGGVVIRVGWNLHMVSGLLILTGITGLATAFVVRHIQLAPRPVAAAS
jgi:hypothetical protein